MTPRIESRGREGMREGRNDSGEVLVDWSNVE